MALSLSFVYYLTKAILRLIIKYSDFIFKIYLLILDKSYFVNIRFNQYYCQFCEFGYLFNFVAMFVH